MARPKKSAAIVVADELETEWSTKREQAQRILVHCANTVIRDAESMATADRRLLSVHGALKEIEERKEQLSRPHLDALAGVRSRVRPVVECLEGAKKALKDAIATFQLAQRAAQDAALAAVNDGARDGETLALAHGSGLVESESMSVTAEWTATVHNPTMVPIEYCDLVPNQAKLDALAKEIGRTGKQVVVPGVHFALMPRGRVRG